MTGANILHLHIPKAAGTTLRAAFDNNKYNVLSIDADFKYDPNLHANVDLFSGHAGYRTIIANPTLQNRVVTILREPHERVASYYFHLVRSINENVEISRRTQMAAKYSFYELLALKDDAHIMSDIYNSMTWKLVWDSDLECRMNFRQAQPRLTDADLVERAKANLNSFLVVGLQTRLDRFAHDLERATGFSAKLGHDNANPSRPAFDEIDAATKRRLRGWIELDIEVYEWALNQFGG